MPVGKGQSKSTAVKEVIYTNKFNNIMSTNNKYKELMATNSWLTVIIGQSFIQSNRLEMFHSYADELFHLFYRFLTH